MATAHPPLDMLAAYAAGAATPGLALLVSAHLTYCPRCRARVGAIESVGGAVLADATPVAMSEGAREATLARLDETGADAAAARRSAPPLPRPILEAAGAPIDGLRWRFRIPGVSEAELAADGTERISLLRVRPGAGVPAHTHTAIEATLVLQGTLLDRGRALGPGDVAVATEDDDHHPKAGPGEDCLCLTVLSGGLRFTGAFGRALNLFAD